MLRPLTLKNNRVLPVMMVMKYTKLYDPKAYCSVSILPTRSVQRDRQTDDAIQKYVPSKEGRMKTCIPRFTAMVKGATLAKIIQWDRNTNWNCNLTLQWQHRTSEARRAAFLLILFNSEQLWLRPLYICS
jgi:hypothetical protein